MLPFTSREDVDFFLHLEMHLRQDHPPLCGRDHLSYRSAYFPVKDVIDGDLCEQFAQVTPARARARTAEELTRPYHQAAAYATMRNGRSLATLNVSSHLLLSGY